jgi:hypothetical protein
MQTLYLPGTVFIDFFDKNGSPVLQENILVGIHTFSTRKNNIDLSPFLSDKEGRITITKGQLENQANIFISHGIMDYCSLESARPDIQIYFWGNNSIDRWIDYRNMALKNKKDGHQYKQWDDVMEKLAKPRAEFEIREQKEFQQFEQCFNRKTKQQQDIILVTDTWDKPVEVKHYRVALCV